MTNHSFNIEDLIKSHEAFLTSIEDVEDKEIDKNLQKLQKHVLFVHGVIESFLKGCIYKHMANSVNDAAIVLMMFRASPLLDIVRHTDILRVAQEIGVLTKPEKTVFDRINNHRNILIHPHGHSKDIEKYKDRTYYLETLQLLRNAITVLIEATNKHDARLSKYESDLITKASSTFLKISNK